MAHPYRRLIAAYDGSGHAREGLALAQRLARAVGAELLLAYVFPSVFPYGPRWQAYDASLREQSDAEEMLGGVQHELRREIEVDTRVVGSSSVARGLHDLAEAEDADLIVLGSSHRGPIGRVLAGSVAERLLQGAPCGVAVAPCGYAERQDAWRTISVAFDGSAESKLALALGSDLATATGAQIRVIAVLEPVTYPASSRIPAGVDSGELARAHREYLERELAQAVEGLAPEVRGEERLIGGDPAEVLCKEGETADLLVVGSRGYGPLGRVLLGSVSTRLVRSAPCPVLVVPRGSATPPAGE